MQLVPPTWVTLHGLSSDGSVDAALARIAATEPETFHTRPLAGYATTRRRGTPGGSELPRSRHRLEYDGAVSPPSGPAGRRHRLVMDGTRWRYERSR